MPMNEDKRRALMEAVLEQYVEKQASEVKQNESGLKDRYSLSEVEAIVKQASVIASEHAEEQAYAAGCLDGMNVVVEKLASESAGGDPRAAYNNDEMAAQYHAGRMSDKVQQLVSAAKETAQNIEVDGHGEEVAVEDEGAEPNDQPAVSGGGEAEKTASEQMEYDLLEALIKEAMEGEEEDGGGSSHESGPGMSTSPKGPGQASKSDEFGDMQGDLSPDTKRERDLSLSAILRAKAESKVQNAG